MKHLTHIFILIVFLGNTGYGQTMKAFLSAAEQAFLSKDYYTALVRYSDALEFDSERTDIRYQAAEAARLFNAYALAEENYQRVIDGEENADYPLASFWLADVKHKQGKYNDAQMLYSRFISENEGSVDDYFIARANKEAKACEWAIDQMENPDESVLIQRLGEEVNTPYSEFGGLLDQDKLYYSSLRFDEPGRKNNPKRTIAKVLISTDGDVGQEIETINDIALHTAHTAFNRDASRVYYTICDYINNEDIRCDLYYRDYSHKTGFGIERKLPDNINAISHTSTQPNIGYDENLKKEVLYFVSDREGTIGKRDIWYSVIEGDSLFSDPKNLAIVNTPEDDITPFYHEESGKLFFSSEGYQGLGGFDIYHASFNTFEDSLVEVNHLRYPSNSSYHDLYYTLDSTQTIAHFSSNREGTLFLETSQEACCYDIHKIDIEKVIINLNALTFDARNNLSLEGVKVRLQDPLTEEIIDYVLNDETNDHEFELEKDKNYIVIAEKSGFKSDTIQLSTSDITTSKELIKKMYLGSDLLALDVTTYSKVTLEPLPGVKVELFNLSDPDAPIQVQFNQEGHDYVFMIERGKSYQLKASKPKFNGASVTFDIEVDADGRISKKLYLGNILTYLPLKLYFDNDRPDPRTLNVLTKKTYSDTYFPFIARKDLFKSRYSKDFRGEQKIVAIGEVENFFEGEVKVGYSKLSAFLDGLLDELQSGSEVEIEVRGHASPLASNQYNLMLSQRRINTVKNEFGAFRSGILIQFIKSGKLKIMDISYGEALAPANISDRSTDKRNSIYSVPASQERRVEIIGVKFKN